MSRGYVNLRGEGFQCPERSSIESWDCKLKKGGGSCVLRGVVLSRGYVNLRGGGFQCPERSSIERRVCKVKERGVPVP